jgi:hypothetical protein
VARRAWLIGSAHPELIAVSVDEIGTVVRGALSRRPSRSAARRARHPAGRRGLQVVDGSAATTGATSSGSTSASRAVWITLTGYVRDQRQRDRAAEDVASLDGAAGVTTGRVR